MRKPTTEGILWLRPHLLHGGCARAISCQLSRAVAAETSARQPQRMRQCKTKRHAAIQLCARQRPCRGYKAGREPQACLLHLCTGPLVLHICVTHLF